MRCKAQTAIKLQSTYLEMDSSNGITSSDLANNDWTISFWTFPPYTGGPPYVFIAGSGFYFYHRLQTFTFKIGGLTKTIAASAIFSRWNHFVITRNGTVTKIYHDNTEIHSYTGSAGVGTSYPFAIGGSSITTRPNWDEILFSQFTFHNKALSASEISMLYGGIGYEDLSEQQKLDLSVVAWHDFLNDRNDSHFGKNYNGSSSDYDFTAGNYSNVSLDVGNFPKRISGRSGDRVSHITSSDPDARAITTDTSNISSLPAYTRLGKFNNKPSIAFNIQQQHITHQNTQWGTHTNPNTSHHFLTDMGTSLNNKDLTIFAAFRELTNYNALTRYLFSSYGTNEAESNQFAIYVNKSVLYYKYSTDGTSSGTKKSERFAAPIPNMQYNHGYILVFELNEDAPKVHVNNLSTTKDYNYGNDITFKRQIFPNTQFSIGARVVGSTAYDTRYGDVAELIVYNKKLSSASVETVKEYLNGKYNLY